MNRSYPTPTDALDWGPASDVRVTSLFLADAVRTPNGLLYVLGGNPESYTFASLPQVQSVVVVCAVHLTNLPESREVKLLATVYDPAGVGVASREFAVQSGKPAGVSLPHCAFDVHFEVATVGEWRLAIFDGDERLAWIPFEVRLRS